MLHLVLAAQLLVAAEPATPTAAPVAPVRESTESRPQTNPPTAWSSGPRLTATVLGSLVGGALTLGTVLGAGALVSAVCGFDCNATISLHPAYLIVGLLAAAGVGPIGAFVGNRLGGGHAPYWRPLIGTLFGLVASELLIVAFDKTGFLRSGKGTELNIGLAVSLSALLPMVAQVLATELGVANDAP